MRRVCEHPGKPDSSNRRFNGQALVAAREATGMSQTALAKAMSVSQPLVSKWETEEDSAPEDDQLVELAEMLGVHPVFLTLPRPIPTQNFSEFYHRKLVSTGRKQIKSLHAQCTLKEIAIDRLLSGYADQDVEMLIPTIDPEDLQGDIEKVAYRCRVAMQVPTGPVKDLTSVIENAGGFVIDQVFAASKVDALCRWLPGELRLFFVNSTKPADRIRFSLAHELGHTVMHYRNMMPLPRAEEQANSFASAFLLPESQIRRDVRPNIGLQDLANLKRKWRVSMQAIIRRASDLKIIAPKRYQNMMVELSRRGWRKTEPVELPQERPTSFNRLLQWHLQQGFEIEQLALLMCMPVARVEELLQDLNAPEVGIEKRPLRLAR